MSELLSNLAQGLGVVFQFVYWNINIFGAPPATFSVGNQILWSAIINSTNTNVKAIHYYDAVLVSATAASKTFATTTSNPSPMSRRPIFHWSATRCA